MEWEKVLLPNKLVGSSGQGEQHEAINYVCLSPLDPFPGENLFCLAGCKKLLQLFGDSWRSNVTFAGTENLFNFFNIGAGVFIQ